MASVADLHNTQKSIESSLLQKMTDFEANLKAASHISTVTQLSEDFKLFKENTWSILKLLRQQISDISQSLDVAEMRHRRKYLIFNGVPEEATQKVEDIGKIICSVLKEKLAISEVTSASFKACHRLGKHTDGSNRPILVRFTDSTIKNTVWKKKTALKGSSIVVAEFLTRPRQALFQSARRQLGVTNCWTLNGNIYAKLPDGTRSRIDNEDDLAKLTIQSSKASGTSTAGTSSSTKVASSDIPYVTVSSIRYLFVKHPLYK